MEIHPPRPVASLKEFFRELLTITTGILIALSLEGLLQWNNHRQLVREARTNIISELRQNQFEIAKEQEALRNEEHDVRTIVTFVHQLELNPRIPVHEFHYGFTIAELQSTSWDTARTTGAVSYMSYGEVKRYTQVYSLQRTFEDLQQRAISASLDMEGLVTLLDRKTGTITPAELSDAERRLGIVLANVIAMEQIAKPLEDRYKEMLKATTEHR
jgi:hypothetical protein